MKAYHVAKDGSVTIQEGGDSFWFDENEEIIFMETEAKDFPGHTIYYDDESIFKANEVRALVAGTEVPLPVWFCGIDGENITSPKISVESLKGSIRLPA